MKRNLLLLVFFLGPLFTGFAQEITMYKTFGGVRFERDSLVLGPRQVQEALQDNVAAYNEFKRARTNYNVAGALGFTGCVLVCIPLGTVLVGGSPEWGFAAGGAALILGSIPFNRIFKARALNALDIYYGRTTSRIKPEFYFSGTNVRLTLRF